MYTIGQFSKLTGLTADTLRYYDKVGLLTPENVNPNTSYRYYTHNQLLQSDVIKVCRSMGMSIDSIRSALQNQDTNEFLELLQTQNDQLHKKIDELLDAIEQVTQISQRIEQWFEVKDAKGFYYRDLPRRRIEISAPFRLADRESPAASNIYLELINRLRKSGNTFCYNGGYLYTLDKGKISHIQMFEAYEQKQEEEGPVIPPGRYLCMTYSQNDREKAMEIFLEKLKSEKIEPLEILDIYHLSGKLNYSNRVFEFQTLIEPFVHN